MNEIYINSRIKLFNNIDTEFNCSYTSIYVNNKFSGIIPDYEYSWDDLESNTKVQLKQIISKFGKFK